MIRGSSTLVLATADVYSLGNSYPVNEICKKYPFVNFNETTNGVSSLADLLGSCQVFEFEDQPTVGILITSFIPGKCYEENPIAQRQAGNLDLDAEMRYGIISDSQWTREVQLRQALQDLKRQINLNKFDEVEFHGTHSKHYNEYGSYFQILRRFFVLDEKTTFYLHLKVGKNYAEFINFGERTFDVNRSKDSCKQQQEQKSRDDIEVPTRAEKLMDERMSQST